MAQESTGSSLAQVTDPIQSVLNRIQDSLANIILSAGILLFVGGVSLELIPGDFFLFQHFPNSFQEQGIWAAIFGLWGMGLLLLGIVLHLITWWSHR